MTLTFKQKQQRRLPIFKLVALSVIGLILLLGSSAFSATDGEKRVKYKLLKDQIGRYMVLNDGMKNHAIWVLDTVTGQLRWCYVVQKKGVSEPKCGIWSEDDREKYGK